MYIILYIYLLYSMCLSLASCHLDAKAFKALPGMSAEVDQAVAAPVGISALPLKLFICLRLDCEKATTKNDHSGKYHNKHYSTKVALYIWFF